MTAQQVDAVVVGAGTAGANVAYQLARRGRSVVVLERRPRRRGGAQWQNGVLDRHFVRAGVDPPAPPERTTEVGAVAHVVGPDGTRGIVVTSSPIVRADMARLGDRLRSLALDAGATIVDEVGSLSLHHRGDRLVAVDADVTPAGGPRRTVRVEAALFVDASGRGGTLRRRSPVLARWCPPVRGPELCAAGDLDLAVADSDGARRFLDRHGAAPGDHVNVVGLHGGWSTRSIRVSPDLREVSLLVGCVADGRHASVPEMIAAARADEPWLGAEHSRGVGVIPLRRPYARLSAPGLALVGDAAAQVFPAHGSGIGLGLVAGTMLAEVAAAAADPGDPAVLWRYQDAFHREEGGTLIAYDGFRRLSTALGSDGVAEMVRAGLLTEAMTTAGLDQRPASPPPLAELPAMVARLAAAPAVAVKMLPRLAAAQLAGALTSTYPSTPDEAALARWDRRVARLLGSPPS